MDITCEFLNACLKEVVLVKQPPCFELPYSKDKGPDQSPLHVKLSSEGLEWASWHILLGNSSITYALTPIVCGWMWISRHIMGLIIWVSEVQEITMAWMNVDLQVCKAVSINHLKFKNIARGIFRSCDYWKNIWGYKALMKSAMHLSVAWQLCNMEFAKEKP